MAKIKKIYQNKFTMLDNAVLQDQRLTWKARGIFCYLWSLPADWQYYETEVANHSEKEGISSLRTGIKELEQLGYLKRTRERKENGSFGEPIWEITNKSTFSPTCDYPILDKPILDNRTLQSTNNTKDLLNKEYMSKSNDLLVSNFEKLWTLYPRKKGKDQAFKSYKKAIKEGVTNKDIQNGIIAYKKEIALYKYPKDKIAHGSTWFNNKRWQDSFDTTDKSNINEQIYDEEKLKQEAELWGVEL